MTAQTPGRALHESLLQSAVTHFGRPVEEFEAWDGLPESQRQRMEDAARAGRGEFVSDILAALRPDPDGDEDEHRDEGESAEDYAIRLAHYRNERITELHRLIATPRPAPEPDAATAALAAAREHVAWIWRNAPDETVRGKADQALHHLTAGGVTAPGREPGENP